MQPGRPSFRFFFFNDTATTEIYTLSLHDALPISVPPLDQEGHHAPAGLAPSQIDGRQVPAVTGIHTRRDRDGQHHRSEEHTSELQSQSNLVCRLLLEKKTTKCRLGCDLYP